MHKTNSELYTGSFGQIRKQLDYQYHAHYRKERQWLHDAVIEDVSLEGEESSKKENMARQTPWLILLIGTRESSKHSFVKDLIDSNRLRLHRFVTVDPGTYRYYRSTLVIGDLCIHCLNMNVSHIIPHVDDIRGYLPEHVSYAADCPERVEELTQAETAYIAETLVRASLGSARNVLWHGMFSDVRWLQETFIPMVQTEYNCRVAVWFITTWDETQSLEPSLPQNGNNKASAILRQVAKSAAKLRTSSDFYCHLTRDVREQIQLKGCGFWKTFEGSFDQSIPTVNIKTPNRMCMLSHRRQSIRSRRMSLLRSSEENNKSDDMNFYGQFAHIRATLDYTYHCNYTHERQRFQDSIVREYLEEAVIKDRNGEVCTTPTEPWIVFTAGAMGAGYVCDLALWG